MLKKYLQNISNPIRDLGNYQFLIKRTLLFCYALSFLYRAYSGGLSFQMENPALRISANDILMGAYNYFDINYFIFGDATYSIIYNIVLFLFLILAFIFIRQKWFAIVFYLLFILYFLGYNSNIGFPSSYLKGFVITGFIFFVNKPLNFNYMWEALRYYACWIYSSAFALKFIHRAFFMPRYGEMTFKDNLSWFIYTNPESMLTEAYLFLIKHSWMLNLGDKLVFLFEGLFILGFFTKKFDTLLGWGIIGLHFFLYFVSDTLFVEIYVLSLLFISAKWWKRLNDYFSHSKQNRSIEIQ